MNQHILKKPVLDFAALEGEIRHRLQQEKNRLFFFHILCLILAMIIIFFIF